jgi:hypothetical protein
MGITLASPKQFQSPDAGSPAWHPGNKLMTVGKELISEGERLADEGGGWNPPRFICLSNEHSVFVRNFS